MAKMVVKIINRQVPSASGAIPTNPSPPGERQDAKAPGWGKFLVQIPGGAMVMVENSACNHFICICYQIPTNLKSIAKKLRKYKPVSLYATWCTYINSGWWQGFPSGGGGGGNWGTPHELCVPPHNSCVPPIKSKNCSPPPSLLTMTKFF